MGYFLTSSLHLMASNSQSSQRLLAALPFRTLSGGCHAGRNAHVNRPDIGAVDLTLWGHGVIVQPHFRHMTKTDVLIIDARRKAQDDDGPKPLIAEPRTDGR